MFPVTVIDVSDPVADRWSRLDATEASSQRAGERERGLNPLADLPAPVVQMGMTFL
jgi:hypothetical protein